MRVLERPARSQGGGCHSFSVLQAWQSGGESDDFCRVHFLCRRLVGGLCVLRNAADLGKFCALYARLLEVFSCFGIFLRYIPVKYSPLNFCFLQVNTGT